jgi:hypothetical protein
MRLRPESAGREGPAAVFAVPATKGSALAPGGLAAAGRLLWKG